MKTFLNRLYAHEVLSESEAFELLVQLASGIFNASQVSSLLSVYLMRSPSAGELKGFCNAMHFLCAVPDLPADVVDIVGTGGDGKNSFNISTLSALVAAAAGVPVVKHGNYASGSVSGSSNVLEYLGYRFTNSNAVLQQQLKQSNICFLHAPLFHPAMKAAAAVRKELGVRTFFNLLGPLINPVQPKMRVLGVSRLQHVRLYQYLLEDNDCRFRIVHSLDGYDEISLTGSFKLVTDEGEQLLHPAELGFSLATEADLYGGDTVASAAAIFLRILRNEAPGTQQEIVIANSGMAIHCAYPEKSLAECFSICREALVSGKAYNILKQITRS